MLLFGEPMRHFNPSLQCLLYLDDTGNKQVGFLENKPFQTLEEIRPIRTGDAMPTSGCRPDDAGPLDNCSKAWTHQSLKNIVVTVVTFKLLFFSRTSFRFLALPGMYAQSLQFDYLSYIYIYIYMIERPLGTILFRLILINFKAFWKIERI